MTDTDEEEVAHVGGEKDVVWGILLVEHFELGPWFMCGSISIVFIRAKTKLQMVGRGKLFRGGRGGGESEPVRIITGGVVNSLFLGQSRGSGREGEGRGGHGARRIATPRTGICL